MNKIIKYFLGGQERSVKAKKNMLWAIFVQSYSVLINLTLIPLTLFILDNYLYGVWITIFNVLSWTQLFDIGIGHGLRNKFAESMSRFEIDEAKEYVSTAYVIMAILALILIVLFILPIYFVNWAIVFNTNTELVIELRYLIGITFTFTIIQFVLKLIMTILTADHKPAWAAFLLSISNTLILLIFILFNDFFKNSLIKVGLVFTFIPLIVLFVTNVFLFRGIYRKFSPSIAYFNYKKVKNLFSLGSQFFIIQIAVLIIFQTDALIISHALSPEEVTPYNIVFRYFGVISMLAAVLLSPFWSAYTDALVKEDYIWMKNTIKFQLKAFIFVLFALIILVFISRPVIHFWLQNSIILPLGLIIGMACYNLLLVWSNIFSSFLNGVSRTRLQIYTSFIGMIINIPLSIFLARYYGSAGVIFATCISISFFAIFGAYDTYKYFKSTITSDLEITNR